MPAMQFTCPFCQAMLQLPHELRAESKVKCSKCQKVFALGSAPAPATVIPPPLAQPVSAAAPSPAAPIPDESDPFATASATAATRLRRKSAKSRKPLILAAAGAAAVLLLAIAAIVFWPAAPPPEKRAQAAPKKDAPAKPAPDKPTSPATTPKPSTFRPEPLKTAKNNIPEKEELKNFDDWKQDFEDAKKRAAKDKKDLLMFFDGSDWDGPSMRLAYEVLFKDDFRDAVRHNFVRVHVDFPQKAENKGKVQFPAQNAELQKLYHAHNVPLIVLADSQGRPYAYVNYEEGDAAGFGNQLIRLQKVRTDRDQLLFAVEQAEGPAKLAAAKTAMEFLQRVQLIDAHFYGPMIAEWKKLADQLDPNNEHGHQEAFFEAGLFQGIYAADKKTPEVFVNFADQLDDWKKKHKFKDANRAARLHIVGARLLAMAEKHERAFDFIKAAKAAKPTDPEIRERLEQFSDSVVLGSGTGMVVSADGHILTNHHVVAGKGKVLVRLPMVIDPVKADIVAEDAKRDIALIRVEVPAGLKLEPLHFGGDKAPGRGERVAALGYPLGDSFGVGLKFTAGVVSALPEPANENMLLLDARINPGNSGGPLCDAAANVVGMVTAKIGAGKNIDSYGMAVPAADLEAFLKKHLKGYKSSPAMTEKLDWSDVDRMVSPSVLMILKAL